MRLRCMQEITSSNLVISRGRKKRRMQRKGTLNGGRRTRTYERQKGTVPGGTKRARVRMGEEGEQKEE